MKKSIFIRTLATYFVYMLPLYISAQFTIIKNPGYFESSIRDGFQVFPDTLFFATASTELEFPDMGTFVQLGDYNFPNLRKVALGNVDYMPGGSFDGLPELEEIVINGYVGHFDCTFVRNCPKLRKVVFKGPVSSTGGPVFAYQCENLDSVIFESTVVNFGLGIYPEAAPKLRNYTFCGAVIKAPEDSLISTIDSKETYRNADFISDLRTIAHWQTQVLTAKGNIKWMRKMAYDDAKLILPILSRIDNHAAKNLVSAMTFAWNLNDDVKTYLDILKESPAYATNAINKERFIYSEPNDSLLSKSRLRFKLDSIAGSDNDIVQIKNLMYWIHNNIRHDGGNGLPNGPLNLSNIYDSAQRDSCGYNCRALAIALTEALLANNIPARYITCESKKWDSDSDCHVICTAWSKTLGKWIWVDPTFAAYVTDENGLLLHPGEVRYRLQHDLPLFLNPAANWNNEFSESKEEYLDEYMAKNLYILSCNMLNQSEPEGESSRQQGKFAALVPLGSNYDNAHIITTDENWFWQAPLELFE